METITIHITPKNAERVIAFFKDLDRLKEEARKRAMEKMDKYWKNISPDELNKMYNDIDLG